jgi:hypothetical protein
MSFKCSYGRIEKETFNSGIRAFLNLGDVFGLEGAPLEEAVRVLVIKHEALPHHVYQNLGGQVH